jgi:hypothetical protein
MAEKITKDLNPTYGSIQKLFSRRISLIAFCEDRVVGITANKNALYNADGNPQIVASNAVLGDANPFEFLNILYFSNYVFTSMFHGVMLSLKYNKQFWYTEDPYRKNKLDFLSNKLKINNRIILTQNNFEKTLDYTKINEEINKLQKSSEEFILSSIKRFKQDN